MSYQNSGVVFALVVVAILWYLTRGKRLDDGMPAAGDFEVEVAGGWSSLLLLRMFAGRNQTRALDACWPAAFMSSLFLPMVRRTNVSVINPIAL